MPDVSRQAAVRRLTRACLCALAAVACAGASPATTATTTTTTTTTRSTTDAADAAALRSACDALVEAAVQRRYGWAWTDPLPPPGHRVPGGAGTSAQAVTVAMDPGATPAIGLVLYHAGRRLGEQRYVGAALDAARGVVAAQERTGRIPSRATFGRSAGGADPHAAVPDRSATRAGLALLLTLLEADGDGDGTVDEATRESLRRSARRAAYWLLKQQTRTGGWPVAHPPDAPPGEARRLFRLDTPDYRTSTLALLLAGEGLEDRTLAFGAARAIDHLLSMRARDVKVGRGLWGTAYHLGGGADVRTIPDADQVDLVATREAMLTLLTSYLLTGDGASFTGLEEAAKALASLKETGTLTRRYPARPATVPATLPGGPFAPPPEPLADTFSGAAIKALLADVRHLTENGREATASRVGAPLPFRQHVALELVLSGTPEAVARSDTAGSMTTVEDAVHGLRRVAPGPRPDARLLP